MEQQSSLRESGKSAHIEEFIAVNGQALAMREGMEWGKDAWTLLKSKFVAWILFTVFLLIIITIFTLVPVLNYLSIEIYIIAGLMAVCEKQRTTGGFFLGVFFSAIWDNFLLLSILSIIPNIVGIASLFFLNNDVGIHIIINLVTLMYSAIIWLAPALVVIHGASLGQAMKMSLLGTIKNILPCILLSVIYSLIIISITILFGLGWFEIIPLLWIPFGLSFFVCIPLLWITIYTAYRSIFIASKVVYENQE